MFTVYTDGSCLGNPGPGGVGILILKNGIEVDRLSFGEPEETTNNRMELLASMSGIAYIHENFGTENKITVISDSKYVVDGMTSWRHGWKKSNWKGCKKNLDLWTVIDVLGDKCIFKWVKGHDKDKYNNIVDDLAQTAARKAKESR